MFATPVPPIFASLLPQTKGLIPLIRKNVSNPKNLYAMQENWF